jgi:diguanylate cyclase (GGDEF)-like protein
MNPSEIDDKARVEYERINAFFKQSRIGYAGMLTSIIFSGFLIRPYTDSSVVIYWMLAIVLTYIPRLAVSVAYTKKKKKGAITPENIESWEKRVQLHSVLPFFAYSSIALLTYNDHVFTGVMIAAFSLISMLTGGILLYRSSLKIIRLYFYVSFACLIGRCLYEGSYQYYLLLVPLLIMLVLIHQLLKTQFSDYVENIARRIQYERASQADPLTGLANRRYMDAFMEKLMPISKRSNQEFQVSMIDIDHFKKYNDTHGHIKGDELLINLSRLIKRRIRSGDLFVRYGGEEFTLILAGCDQDSAQELFEEIMVDIKEELGVSISVGLSSSHRSNDFYQLLELADDALYSSKQKGRDCITFA